MRCCVALVVWTATVVMGAEIASSVLFAAGENEEGGADEWKVPARAERRANPVAADEESIAAGKKLYVQECLDCHGKAGRGDGAGARDLEVAMPDLSDPQMWKQSDGAMFYKITEGREPMPATDGLSEEDRWHLVNYVRTFAPRPRDREDENAQAARGK